MIVGIANKTCASDKSIVFRFKTELYFCLPVINELKIRSATGNSQRHSENF